MSRSAVWHLDSPFSRIGAHTGEPSETVQANLVALGLRGYNPDDIWTLVRGALNSGMTTADLVAHIGDKAQA